MNCDEDLHNAFTEICIIADDEKTYQGAIKWHINELELRQCLEKWSNGYYIDSNTFSIGTPSYCSFYFRILPGEGEFVHYITPPNPTIRKFYTQFVCVSIIFNRKLPKCAWIKGEIHFEGINSRKTFCVSAKDFDKKIEIYDLCVNSDSHKLLYSTNGCSMHCSVKIRERELKCTFDKEKNCYAESRNYDSIKETFKSDTFSDVSVTIDGHLFKTHKTLLAQIPYFRELFDANESKRQFELADIEHEIFKHLLTFLYSGDIPQLHFKLACKLYITASDLKVLDLKSLCSSYLGANLTEINVIMVLKFCHAYEDIDLKRECFKFIKKSDIETLAQKSIVQ